MRQLVLAAAAAIIMGTAACADTIKGGGVGPLSGPVGLQGKNGQAGGDANLAPEGGTSGGK
ncbi:ABC transporter substrate-binding protein, partial [Rhizobium sp. SEMIA 4085]|nr:ABC transporter substrate-binding protein [Rhizobium sp. SEMIA 4085]